MPRVYSARVFADPRSEEFKRQLASGGIALAYWERVTELGPQWPSRDIPTKLEWIVAQAAGFLSLGYTSSGFVHISDLKLPEYMRGRSVGTAIMRGLCWQADYNGWALSLEPESPTKGGTDPRLVRFYKGFGFVQNRGKSASPDTSAGMLRYPVGQVR